MYWSKFMVNVKCNGLFNKAFEDHLVYHNMWCGVSVSDEFAMLTMGGEL